jgi:hypothetical protein
MTTKRVHIYCIAITAFVVAVTILDEIALSIDIPWEYGYYINIFIIAVPLVAEILVTPITSIWVCIFNE